MSPDRRSFTDPLIASLVLWLCSPAAGCARTSSHRGPMLCLAAGARGCGQRPPGPDRRGHPPLWGEAGDAGGWRALSCAVAASSTAAGCCQGTGPHARRCHSRRGDGCGPRAHSPRLLPSCRGYCRSLSRTTRMVMRSTSARSGHIFLRLLRSF